MVKVESSERTSLGTLGWQPKTGPESRLGTAENSLTPPTESTKVQEGLVTLVSPLQVSSSWPNTSGCCESTLSVPVPISSRGWVTTLGTPTVTQTIVTVGGSQVCWSYTSVTVTWPLDTCGPRISGPITGTVVSVEGGPHGLRKTVSPVREEVIVE